MFNLVHEHNICEIAINKEIVEAGMSVIPNDDNFWFADRVQEIYDSVASRCYFFTDNDPNSIEFSKSTYLCFLCQIKAAKLPAYYGMNIKDCGHLTMLK